MPFELPTHLRPKKKLRILCADDNSLLGQVLIKFFATAGHEVAHVSDGLDAWTKLSSDTAHFEVLVTNHHMPGLSGLELVEMLAESSFRGRIIVHSVSLDAGAADRYRALGVEHIVFKSTAARELSEVVEAFHEA